MSESEGECLLRTDQEELTRMGLQHSLWRPVAEDLWEAAKIDAGMRVLDLGCGPGDASMDLAERVGPEGSVLAIDRSSSFLSHLRKRVKEKRWEGRVETKKADFCKLGLETESLDAVWARWAFCWDPDPSATLAQVAQALRPGGTLIVQDYLMYGGLRLDPREPAFERVVEAVSRSWEDSGGDPDICSRLPSLIGDSDLFLEQDIHITRTISPDEPMWEWPTTFFLSFVPELVELGLLDGEEAEAFEKAWERASLNPATRFPLPPMRGQIAKKS